MLNLTGASTNVKHNQPRFLNATIQIEVLAKIGENAKAPEAAMLSENLAGIDKS